MATRISAGESLATPTGHYYYNKARKAVGTEFFVQGDEAEILPKVAVQWIEWKKCNEPTKNGRFVAYDQCTILCYTKKEVEDELFPLACSAAEFDNYAHFISNNA